MAINKIEADYDKGCKLYNVVKSETINPLRLIEENKTKDPGIDKSLALERKIESRKRNFSLDLENLIVSISLSTLDFREW